MYLQLVILNHSFCFFAHKNYYMAIAAIIIIIAIVPTAMTFFLIYPYLFLFFGL